MFSLLSKNRKDDASKNKSDRTDRFEKQGDHWYFKTREGLDIGPFEDRNEAQYALLYFVERSEWPDAEQLKSFIEGCEYNSGTAAEIT
ncbi:MAG: hypothetical protein HRU20_02755 [Pseudomonadales bacterium]|nr:hypothetical protein [Pseudomonadales bacterium]